MENKQICILWNKGSSASCKLGLRTISVVPRFIFELRNFCTTFLGIFVKGP